MLDWQTDDIDFAGTVRYCIWTMTAAFVVSAACDYWSLWLWVGAACAIVLLCALIAGLLK